MKSIKLLLILLGCFSIHIDLHAAEQYFVLDAGVRPFTPMVGEPYRWLLPDGTQLGKPKRLTDKQGRAFVTKALNQEEYLLDLMWGRFKVHVDPKCWKGAPENFQKCAKIIGRIEGCKMFECKTTPPVNFIDDYLQKNTRRSQWVLAEISEKEAEELVENEIQALEKPKLSELIAAAEKDFVNCPAVDMKAPNPKAEALYQKGMEAPMGSEEGEVAFIEAAKLGYWRAASNLVLIALEKEDFESAYMITAWLIKHKAPSAYNKLAMTLHVIISNEADEPVNTDAPGDQLLLKSAMAGDPRSMLEMGKKLQSSGHPELGSKMIECSRILRPDLSSDAQPATPGETPQASRP